MKKTIFILAITAIFSSCGSMSTQREEFYKRQLKNWEYKYNMRMDTINEQHQALKDCNQKN